MVAGVYIPPAGSPCYKEDTFNIIDNEIFQNVEPGKPLLLLGDFNARTSCAPDYTSVHDNFYIDDEELNNFLTDISNLDNLDIPRERANQDKGRMNQHGVKLLNLCKGHNIYILNGRCGSDKHIGKTTSKDYAIGTHHIFKMKEMFYLTTQLTHFIYVYDLTYT